MKKLFFVIGLALTAGILFTAQSPSLDGRAVVADAGVFPKGLFAKTVGYLPGDTISVTNPANSERVDILVIGSLDPSEGVAVLLSPEAAQALNIKKNSNNLVKLTKRSGTADEIANGSAVIANSAGAAPETASENLEEEKPLSQVIEEAVENGESVEEAVQAAVADAEEKAADEIFDETDAELEAEEELAAEEEAAEETAEEIAEAEAAEEAAEEIAEEAEETAEVAELVEESEEAEAEYPEYEAVEDELAGETEEAAEEEFVEDVVLDEESVAASEEPVEDEYEAIVLVPSESKAPEASLVEETSPVEEAPVFAESESLSSRVGSVAYLDSFGELAEQKYYVQIAACSKSESVEEIAGKYADRYPIAVVRQSSRSPVLVGPLNVDEYGVVLERFKAYGFKDAFVRKR